jgi:hypothetical protein
MQPWGILAVLLALPALARANTYRPGPNVPADVSWIQVGDRGNPLWSSFLHASTERACSRLEMQLTRVY